MKKILIIDDDYVFIEMLKSILKDFEVIGETSSEKGILKLKSEKFDMLILDFMIDEKNDGIEVVEKIRKFDKEIYIFMLTACEEEAPGIEILNNVDVQNYYNKEPENFDKIVLAIKAAIKSIEHFKEDTSISSRLKELRSIHNISQKELASIAGVQRAAVAQWEVGNNDPSLDNLKKIAEHFKVSMDWLTGYQIYKRK